MESQSDRRSKKSSSADDRLKLIISSNLYSFGKPSRVGNEILPLTAKSLIYPCTKKGRVRADLEQTALAAHSRGEINVAIVRASDFYGPGVIDSALGERFFGALVKGKAGVLLGKDVPHSYAFISDYGETMAILGTKGNSKQFGRSWIVPHGPPLSPSEIGLKLEPLTNGPVIKNMGGAMLRFGGLFVPAAKEMIEMLYEFNEPFTVDSGETESVFGIRPTPFDKGFHDTIEWYRDRSSSGRMGEKNERTAPKKAS